MTKRCLALWLIGVAALPSAVQAQYPRPGYYYPQPPAYRAAYPYYQQAPYPGYYYAQPAPTYAPAYPQAWQGMPAYQQQGMQVRPAPQQAANSAVATDLPAAPSAPPLAAPPAMNAPAKFDSLLVTGLLTRRDLPPAPLAVDTPTSVPEKSSPAPVALTPDIVQAPLATTPAKKSPALLPIPSVDKSPAPLPIPSVDKSPAPLPIPSVDKSPAPLTIPVVDKSPAPDADSVPAPKSPAPLAIPSVDKSTAPLVIPHVDNLPPAVKSPAPGLGSATLEPAVKVPVLPAKPPVLPQSSGGKEYIPAPLALQQTPTCLTDCVQPNRHCFSIFAEYLYWNVHGVDVPFAQPFDGVDPVFSVPRGPVGVVSPQFQSGFRVGGGVSISDDAWVVGRFTYFFTQRTADAAASDGLVLRNFLSFPNTANAGVDSLTASADYRIRLLVADIDYKCAIVNNEHLLLNWTAGARYAHIDQNLFSKFEVTGTTTVDSTINFDGIGPRIGLEGQYRVAHGFYGYAQGIVDVLFGQFRGNYEEKNVFTGLVGLTSINANRVVPVLELEVGGGWLSQNGRVRVSGGYYVGSWYNAMTTTSFAGAIGNVNFTTNGNNFRDNIVFDGLVLRCEFRY